MDILLHKFHYIFKLCLCICTHIHIRAYASNIAAAHVKTLLASVAAVCLLGLVK